MGCHIHINQHNNITLRLHWNGRETWEGTGLPDTKANRATVARIQAAVTAEIKARTFTRERYLHYFPNGQRSAQIRSELGLLTAGSTPTVKFYAENIWLPRLTVPLVRASYARDARGHLDRYICKVIGHMRLAEVTTADVANLRAHWLTEGKGVKTLHNAIQGTLRALFREAVTVDKLITVNPCAGITWPRQTITAPDPLTKEERDKVLAYFRASRPIYFPFIATLLYTGMRPGEAVALRWGNVDLRGKPRLQILSSRVLGEESTPKTSHSERTIALVPELVPILRDINPLHADMDTFVFTGRDGHPLNQDRVSQRIWRKTPRRLGIRPRKLYACRHTFISIALSAGANLKYLADYCGTSVTMIEKRYGKFIGAGDEQLSRLTGGENGDFGQGVTGQARKAQSSRRRRKGE
jgi:integrase